MRILILHDEIPPGARPDELDALTQASVISEALANLGHHSSSASFQWDLEESRNIIERARADVVFNLVESVQGQGRLVYLAPALFDAVGIAFTGSSTEAMFLTANKILTKKILSAGGIATPPWVSEKTAVLNGLSVQGRYIIKSVWEEASVGLDEDSILWVECAAAIRDAIQTRKHHLGGEGFAEEFVEGREFNLSLLADGDGAQVLPPAEIRFVDYAPGKPRIVGYRAKWESDSFEYNHTPRRFDFPEEDVSLLKELSRIALSCWKTLELRGYARVDFRVDGAGRPWVLEVNANPCLSPDAGFFAAAQQAGLTFARVVERILADAILACPTLRRGLGRQVAT
jgi:D-alanine-D-alanine ligase